MRLYAITPGTLRDEAGFEALAGRCGELARTGVETVLIREKQLEAGALVRLCRLARVEAVGARVVVSGRVDVALAAGLDGVHLSGAAGELTPGQVREVMPGAWVSVSCHALEEVVRARDGGADAVLFGPVFGKVVDGVPVAGGAGLEALREACGVGVPVFALGGVGVGNVGECKAAGAVGVAGIRMFFG